MTYTVIVVAKAQRDGKKPSIMTPITTRDFWDGALGLRAAQCRCRSRLGRPRLHPRDPNFEGLLGDVSVLPDPSGELGHVPRPAEAESACYLLLEPFGLASVRLVVIADLRYRGTLGILFLGGRWV